MRAVVVGFWLAAVLATSACNGVGGAKPPPDFLTRRIDANSHLIVAQVAEYYHAGGSSWRMIGDGEYALDVNDRDPLTNQSRTINILFQAVSPTRVSPEFQAHIVDFALNGERLGPADVRSLVQLITSQTGPPAPTVFSRAPAGHAAAATDTLECVMGDAAPSFGPFSVGNLDEAFANDRTWIRYERTGGVLEDGTPFFYLVYAASPESQQRVEYAVSNKSGHVTILGRQDFVPEGARSEWKVDWRQCEETSRLISSVTQHQPALPETVNVDGVSVGMRYGQARDALIAAGYAPFGIPYKARDCSNSDFERSACAANRELIECSGTGTNVCRLAFVRNSDSKLLIVLTEGEWTSNFAAQVGVSGLAWADLDTAGRVRPCQNSAGCLARPGAGN